MEEYLLKVVVVGDMHAGKTCLLLRYCDDTFQTDYKSTIGVDFKMKDLERDDCLGKLQLWDTAGQDRFRTIVASFYRGAEGLVVVYDITDRSSFEKVTWWIEEARYYGNDSCIAMLVGNKTDLEMKRQVSTKEGEALAKQLGIKFFETSAKNTSNVKEMFDTMADTIIARKKILSGQMHPASGQTGGIVDIRSTSVLSYSEWCAGYVDGSYCAML
ncbi:ras-related protein rab-1b [Plakobranchus ocellatus]|uniref:Ras-related protein rab-1b n=1 Tax=Plakobranchus ocellatus TaxID=259542 RepID=A0AAV4ACI3_9GAST|nr:ras-related protein rab-1b [Plakobranchus ocellatus]